MIGNSIRMLANNPDLVSELGRNRSLLSQFMAEALRFDSPVQNTRRYVFEDTILEGKHLPNGAQVLVLLWNSSNNLLLKKYLAKKITRVVGLPAERSRKHLAYSYMHTAA